MNFLLFVLAGVLAVSGCSSEDSQNSRPRVGTGDTGEFGNADPVATDDDSFGNNTDGVDVGPNMPVNTGNGCVSGGAGASGDFEFSYIWVANAGESTISKIDTRSLEEVGRYLTRADNNGNPSRTSVNLSGDVAVANRNGGVAKFYAREDDCEDKNGDGVIQTSTGKADVLAWDAEECRAWYADFQYNSQRPVAWAPGVPDSTGCNRVGAKVWTSGTSYPCADADCQVDVIRLDGDTGAVDHMETIAGLSGSNFISAGLGGFDFGLGGIGISGYGAYGGAADGDGNFWLFISNTTQLIRVDNASLAHEIWKIPSDNGYGITVDEKGRVFVCGQGGVTRFDYTTGQFMDNAMVMAGFNGCMTDGAGTIWVGGGDGTAAAIQALDGETMQLKQMIAVPGGAKGVSIDFDGYVWAIAKGNVASRVDPMSGEIMTYDGLNEAYSYSDMTGFGLRSAGVAAPPD